MLNKHRDILDQLKQWFHILLGTAIMCAGFVFFINPYNIIPGGVYGASIVLHNIFPSIQVGTFGYFFDVPLLLMSLLLFGKKVGIRTIVAALSAPIFMNIFSWLAYPSQQALEALDPTQLCSGLIDLSDHLMLATIIGSVVIGVGEKQSHYRRLRHRGNDIPKICTCEIFERDISCRLLCDYVWCHRDLFRFRHGRSDNSVAPFDVLLHHCHLCGFTGVSIHYHGSKKRQTPLYHQRRQAPHPPSLYSQRP